MIISFILLILILISYYFVNSKEHLISTNSDGKKITYEGDTIRYTCGDTDQVIHNDDTPSDVIQSSHILDASIELNPSDNQGDVYYGTGNTANKIQCKCKNGYSVDPTDSTTCICPAGKYITNGNCADCASGTYTDEEDQTSCKFPSAGKYANSTSSQIECDAGTFAEANNVARGHGTTGCATPSAGHYANSTISETLCAAGTWASGNTTARTSCTSASTGYYVAAEGRWYQDPCPAGEYQDDTGQTECKFPSAGKYANSTSSQIECDAGTWAATNNVPRVACANPSAGHYALSTTSQTACSTGTWAATNNVPRGHGTTGCANPGVGKYANSRTSQTECATGTFAAGNTTARTSCTSASTGHYVPLTGRWYEDSCPAGKYQDATGQTECKFPSAGNYADADGKDQTECAAGTFAGSSSVARTACTPASKGNYVLNNVYTYQSSCAQGEYQPHTGQSSCKPCNSGDWHAFSGCGEVMHDYGGVNHHACENVNNAVHLPASGGTHCLYKNDTDNEGNRNDHGVAW